MELPAVRRRTRGLHDGTLHPHDGLEPSGGGYLPRSGPERGQGSENPLHVPCVSFPSCVPSRPEGTSYDSACLLILLLRSGTLFTGRKLKKRNPRKRNPRQNEVKIPYQVQRGAMCESRDVGVYSLMQHWGKLSPYMRSHILVVLPGLLQCGPRRYCYILNDDHDCDSLLDP